MAKSKNTYPKTFRPSIVSRIGTLIPFSLLGFFCLVFLAIFLNPENFTMDLPNGFIIFLFMLMYYFILSILWYSAEYIFHFAIIVTPDGLWFHGYGKRFYTWESLSRLNPQTNALQSSIWGIKATHTHILNCPKLVKWIFGSWSYNNFIPLEGVVKVPKKWLLLHDIEAFKKTEFGQELFYFAPHLFEDETKHKRKNRLRDADDYDYDIVERTAHHQEDNLQ